jgi:L-histidine Nalpha-methyltransferase
MTYHIGAGTALTTFFRDVIAGLSREPKSIPCKYFYDAVGSELFDRITDLDEYYLTRAEMSILEGRADEIAAVIGSGAVLIELGSGSSRKTRILLDQLAGLAAYVPVDISEDHLLASSEQLRTAYPHIPVFPVAADYTQEYELPPLPEGARRVAFFPGSTIGNFSPDLAKPFLARIARLVGRNGGLLIGVDLPKEADTIERAYDDASGVTAAFNRNLLHRINRELDGDIDPEAFEHRAVWTPDASRVEMYLVSDVEQEITVGGHRFRLGAGESIHTENSHKYSLENFESLARESGFRRRSFWLDAEGLFSVQYLEVAA